MQPINDPAQTKTQTTPIDPLDLNEQTSLILHAVFMQHANRNIFPSFSLISTLRKNTTINLDSTAWRFAVSYNETQYSVYLELPIVKFQSKKHPTEYRYAVLNEILGAGKQGAVYMIAARIKMNGGHLEIKRQNTFIVKIMMPFALNLSGTVIRDAAVNEGLMMHRASDIYNPRNTIFDAEINIYALMSKRFPGENLQYFLYRCGLIFDVNFTFEKRMHLAILLLSALNEIHSKKIVHRDIKTGNIIIQADKDDNPLHAWLIDLGLSVEADLDTTGGITPGTPLYISPEAWRGQRLNTAADIFALQRIYWCIFGDINMMNTVLVSTNLAKLIQGIIPEKNVFFKQINYSINKNALDALYALFVRMNANDPSNRATMDECITALIQIACDHIPGFAINFAINFAISLANSLAMSEATQQLSATATHISPPITITTHESDESEQLAAVASSSYSPRLYAPSPSVAAAITAAVITPVSPTIPTCPRK